MAGQYFAEYPNIVQDQNARTLSFFFSTPTSFFDQNILCELKQIAKKDKISARISLHDGPDNSLHNMIIMQTKDAYVRPHYHQKKAEAYHLIHGSQLLVIFDKEGNILDKQVMEMDGIFIYRFEKGMYHMTIPLSDYVIFHESKIGPFIREGDSIWAPWAPDGSDQNAVTKFLHKVIES